MCRRVFLQRDVLKFNCEFINFILLLISTEVIIIMSSPGQKRGTCGHVMAIFDGHLKCARCLDKGVGEDICVLKKDCPSCKAFTPEQIQQLATPTYRDRKNKDKKMVSSSPTPTLVDPSHVSVLGKVEGEKATVKPETTLAGKKTKQSDSPKPSPRSSKKKPSTSSRPSSEDLKNLDDKWAERFARLEAMLLSKSFAVPVEPVVKPAEVITNQKQFFDPGASTSKLAECAEPSGPSLVQATGDAVLPRGDEIQQNATQPVEAAGVGMATQPVQAPGAGPDVLPSGTGDAAGGRVVQSTSGCESEDEQPSEAGSLLEGNFRDGSPDRELTRDKSADQELSEEASYRETIRGVRSFMGWHKVPEFECFIL